MNQIKIKFAQFKKDFRRFSDGEYEMTGKQLEAFLYFIIKDQVSDHDHRIKIPASKCLSDEIATWHIFCL